MTDQTTPGGERPEEGQPAETPSEARLRELLRVGAEGAQGDGAQGDAFSAVYAVRRRLRRRWALRSTMAGATAALVVAAVLVAADGGSGHPAPPVAVGPTGGRSYRLADALVSFDACSDYLSYVKSQALAVVGPYGLQSAPGLYGGPIYRALGGAASMASGAGVAASGTDAAVGSAGPALLAPAAAPAQATGGPTFSTTNDQVAGVDEPDTVKTDGRLVVTLVGSTLRVLDSGARVVGTVALPGDTGGGLLLDGNRVVVLSTAPASQLGTVGYVPDVGMGAAVAPGGVPAPTAAQARATVVDLSDPAHPQVLRSFVFDGAEVAARLVGGQVRLVLRSDGPRLAFVTPATTGDAASATATNRRLIQDSTAADWLPYWQLQSPDGAATARQPLTSCQQMARPRQASGLSTVTVFSLDPGAPAPGAATSVVAAGDTVYATADHVYVAGPTGRTANPYAGATPSGCCAILPPAGASTAIYRFTVGATGAPVFDGAGTVPGWLIDSYAMDEDPLGDLRVATTAQSAAAPAPVPSAGKPVQSAGGIAQPAGAVAQPADVIGQPPGYGTASMVSVLRLTGGQLATIGSVGGLGAGEFIKTVRFIGDLAYVVTYQSFDPLYVVDLANPRAPVLAGQLAQPGFSEFLYPVSDRLLIGVGVQITDGEPSGLVVATYDVSDPAHPRRVDSSTLASGYQYVAQGYDPHAFLYWPATDLALLAVPADGEYGTTGLSSGIAAYQVGGSGQLTRTATLAHGSTSTTRSAVINGQVWAFSDAGVLTAGLSDLGTTAWHGY